MATILQFENLPLKKGQWSTQEDQALIAYIKRYGIWNWNEMPKAAGLQRSGKSCRLRWMNYLRPNLKRGNFTEEEDEIILALHQKLGNSWAAIASALPGRTDNGIKNHWHSHLRKRFNNNFDGQETSEVPIKETKSADLSSSRHTKHNFFTSDSSSSIFSEDGIVFSPEFYQYLDQYLQDQENQETDYKTSIDDENRWNQSISPRGTSSSSNSTIWPPNWENAGQSIWANEEINVCLSGEVVPNVWERF